MFDESTLNISHFLFFGGAAGEPLPDLSQLPIGKHTRANQNGEKLSRNNIRDIPKGRFTRIESCAELFKVLFLV